MSCADIGLDVLTEADGLACGKASPLCCTMVADLCGGIYTVDDESLFTRLAQLVECEGEAAFIEPSCCAALEGPRHLVWVRDHGRVASERQACARMLDGAVHVIWATGGSLVPEEERQRFLERGRRTLTAKELGIRPSDFRRARMTLMTRQHYPIANRRRSCTACLRTKK